ncbi:MAG: DUF3943 domain-containing protein [Leptospirales bacterium]|nr:DUF3943 domain-containing protein [Leptospirales bacterium]
MPLRNIGKYVFIIFLSTLFLLVNFPLKAQDQDIEGTGAHAPSEEEYQPKPASFTRALIGMSLSLTVGTIGYYANSNNKKDQIFGNSIINEYKHAFSLSKIKFDDNYFDMNSPTHPLSGSLYYLCARTSGFNIWQSYLFAFAGSAFWECISEVKEVISINDMIFTTQGGIAIGESVFQLVAFYAGNAKSQNFFNDLISDQVDIAKYKYTNGTGQNSSIWHNIYGFAGILYELDDMAGGKFGIDAEFFGIRDLKLRGASSGFHFNAPYTKIVMSAAFSKKLQEAFLYSEIAIMGYSKQRITQSGGYSAFLSLNIAFDYDNRNFADFHDKTSAIHWLGPVADISLTKGGFTFRLRNSIFYDFAMVTPIALTKYYEAGYTQDDLIQKGAIVQASAGYYYAQGFAFTSLASIGIYSFELGGEFKFNRYYSFNGDGITSREPKRHENLIMRDTRISYKVFVQYMTESRVAFRLGATYSVLEGKVSEYSRTLNALRTEFLSAYCI